MGMSENELNQNFSDGRWFSTYHDVVMKKLFPDLFWPNESVGYDFITPTGEKWEARGFIKGKASLVQSCMKGTGRDFDFIKHEINLQNLNGFFIRLHNGPSNFFGLAIPIDVIDSIRRDINKNWVSEYIGEDIYLLMNKLSNKQSKKDKLYEYKF